ncbi:hypothetical protein C8Q76DRAFT_802390 [Earliella scabrosa]|nr:hypothetical protein C8Q76DRAFT_802390 [Earliella scabrosa]
MTASGSDLEVPGLLQSIDSGLLALQRQCGIIAESIEGVHRRIAGVEADLAGLVGERALPSLTLTTSAPIVPPFVSAPPHDEQAEAEASHGKRRMRAWEADEYDLDAHHHREARRARTVANPVEPSERAQRANRRERLREAAAVEPLPPPRRQRRQLNISPEDPGRPTEAPQDEAGGARPVFASLEAEDGGSEAQVEVPPLGCPSLLPDSGRDNHGSDNPAVLAPRMGFVRSTGGGAFDSLALLHSIGGSYREPALNLTLLHQQAVGAQRANDGTMAVAWTAGRQDEDPWTHNVTPEGSVTEIPGHSAEPSEFEEDLADDEDCEHDAIARSSPVPIPQEEDDEAFYYPDEGEGSADMTFDESDSEVTAALTVHADFAGRIEEAKRLAATPAPYGTGYRDLQRVKLINGTLRDLGLSNTQGDTGTVTVRFRQRWLDIGAKDVMNTFGMVPGTYHSIHSRFDNTHQVFCWLEENPTRWASTNEESVEWQFWATMREFFGPTRLPEQNKVHNPPLSAYVREAIEKGSMYFYNTSQAVWASFGLPKAGNLVAPPKLLDE